MTTSIGRQIYLSTVTAPAGRARQGSREELKADRIKIRVKHTKIEPAITPTEEEMKAHFDANPEMYRNPEKVNAEFLALSRTADARNRLKSWIVRGKARILPNWRNSIPI